MSTVLEVCRDEQAFAQGVCRQQLANSQRTETSGIGPLHAATKNIPGFSDDASARRTEDFEGARSLAKTFCDSVVLCEHHEPYTGVIIRAAAR